MNSYHHSQLKIIYLSFSLILTTILGCSQKFSMTFNYHVTKKLPNYSAKAKTFCDICIIGISHKIEVKLGKSLQSIINRKLDQYHIECKACSTKLICQWHQIFIEIGFLRHFICILNLNIENHFDS